MDGFLFLLYHYPVYTVIVLYVAASGVYWLANVILSTVAILRK